YERPNWELKSECPVNAEIGTFREPVSVTGLAANFSAMPRMAPSPLGLIRVGAVIWNEFWGVCLPVGSFPVVSGMGTLPQVRAEHRVYQLHSQVNIPKLFHKFSKKTFLK